MPPLTRSLRTAFSYTALSLPLWAFAQAPQEYGRVLMATPIYETVAQPKETCTELYQRERCETRTVYEDQIAGYDVLYEYKGQQYTQRMAQNPGKRVPIQTPTAVQRYNSSNLSSGTLATPGQNSYSSTPPGASNIDSIQYYPQDDNYPVQIDLHTGRPNQPR